MTTQTGARPEALARAAAMAGYAPSIHNTQPWKWTVLADRMELSAVRDRQLAVADPDGRLLVMSCGTALHHATTALAAAGWGCEVDRLPDPGRPDLLAVVTPTTHETPEPAAMRLVQQMEMRHSDRRPVSDTPVGGADLRRITEVVREQGLHLQILNSDQVYDLAAAANRADAAEREDPAIRDEMAYWISRGGGLGMPSEVLPGTPAQTTVPDRDFGPSGTLAPAPGHDQAAVYGVVYGDGDDPQWWLRAGEALSAAWLTAVRLGVSLLPLSAAVEVAPTRMALRRVLAELGWPYIVVRLGIADPDHAGPGRTPRLAPSQIVDTAGVRHLLDRD